ncbi:MAG: EAL domain-containing protein [Dokdonella sp.]|uniref:putative bifunctional diguanylate cyclase/phosphodiesterase n=1 Tax=Dokdonella sp. TaxID=2291710 RepID=UPI0025C5314E|nr:EAL domain-containing protein [Dokdonella sp.]MBZ0223430.1 EAL domain-containing protein [Dokdonella sp.]MCC7256546.1 EAL domain-containing protein [Dokdonella sp.]
MALDHPIDTLVAEQLLAVLAELATVPEASLVASVQARLEQLPGVGTVVLAPAHVAMTQVDRCIDLTVDGTRIGHLGFVLEDAEAFAICERLLRPFAATLARLLHERELEEMSGDVRARVRALHESEQRFRDLFESSPDPCWLIEHGRFIDCNRAASVFLGYERREDILQHPARLSPEFQPDGRLSAEKAEEMMDCALRNGVHRFEWEHRRANGACFPAEVTLARIDMQGRPVLYCVWRDISRRKQIERQVHELAYFDPLTHLPNRRLLHDRIDQALTNSARDGSHGALIFLDLDEFKWVNDTEGHDAGDRLLVDVGRRLLGMVRACDTVARMGGDEFVLLIRQLAGEIDVAVSQVGRIAEKVLEALNQPCAADAQVQPRGASLGIAMFSGHSLDATELLKRADLAMYQAKSDGRGMLRFYEPGIQAAINARARLEAELRAALVREEFVLYFQPQVDGSGQCIGVEGLLRWNHPTRGLVAPLEFIQLAEETGLILAIGRQVLAIACVTLQRWLSQPATSRLRLAVNVSPRQLHAPNFAVGVRTLLSEHGIEPTRLNLEITESSLLEDVDRAIGIMRELGRLGIGFALDDFGTGFSSLSHVKRLPISQIKIDKSFVQDIDVDASSAAICAAVIAMGLSLGLHTLAEGVETHEQWAFLARQGCHAAQGFLHAPPMPERDLLEWLAQRH